jgi:hypothetical protein
MEAQKPDPEAAFTETLQLIEAFNLACPGWSRPGWQRGMAATEKVRRYIDQHPELEDWARLAISKSAKRKRGRYKEDFTVRNAVLLMLVERTQAHGLHPTFSRDQKGRRLRVPRRSGCAAQGRYRRADLANHPGSLEERTPAPGPDMARCPGAT